MTSGIRVMTHIGTGDAGESHASLDLIQLFALSDNVVNILQDTGGNGSSIAGVGVQGLDDFLDGDWGVAGSPGVEISRSADEGVAVMSGRS